LLRRAGGGPPERRAWWLLVAPACLAAGLERALFGVSWLVALGSLPVALGLAYVAARAMGGAGVGPTKALTPLAQGLFGVAERGLAEPTMAPNLTGAVAIHAADTVGSLKASAILGAPARVVIAGRALGCVLGAVVVVAAYRAILPDARALPTVELPAPAVL